MLVENSLKEFLLHNKKLIEFKFLYNQKILTILEVRFLLEDDVTITYELETKRNIVKELIINKKDFRDLLSDIRIEADSDK